MEGWQPYSSKQIERLGRLGRLGRASSLQFIEAPPVLQASLNSRQVNVCCIKGCCGRPSCGTLAILKKRYQTALAFSSRNDVCQTQDQAPKGQTTIFKVFHSRIYNYIILYYVMLCYVMLYYVMLYYIILYYILLSYIISYYIILYFIILYYIILYYVVLCCIMLYYTGRTKVMLLESSYCKPFPPRILLST